MSIHKSTVWAAASAAIFAAGAALATPLPAGSIAVVRVSGGTLPLAVTGNNVFIDLYSPTIPSQSAPMSSIALQTATTTAAGFTLPGALNSGLYNEGRLNLSADGSTLLLGGYSFKTSSSNYVGNSNPTANPRIVASIPLATGTPSYSAGMNVFGNATSGQPISAVVSPEGTSFYAGSSTNLAGVTSLAYYSGMGGGNPSFTFATASTALTRSLSIVNGNLLGLNSNGLYMFNGLPTSGSPTSSPLFSTTGVPNAGNPQDFVAFDTTGSGGTPNLIYVVDSSTAQSSGGVVSGGGIQRWDFDGSVWTLSYTLNAVNNLTTTGIADTFGFTNIAGQVGPDGRMQLVVTTSIDAAGRNMLMSVTDNGPQGLGASQFTLLAQSAARNTFRDVVFVPAPTSAAAILGLGLLFRRRR